MLISDADLVEIVLLVAALAGVLHHWSRLRQIRRVRGEVRPFSLARPALAPRDLRLLRTWEWDELGRINLKACVTVTALILMILPNPAEDAWQYPLTVAWKWVMVYGVLVLDVVSIRTWRERMKTVQGTGV